MGFTGRNETFTKMDFLQSDCVMLRTALILSILLASDRISAMNCIKTLVSVVVLDFRRYIKTV